MSKTNEIKEEFDHGKYTIIFSTTEGFKALRYGLPWRDLTGDGMVLSMLYEVEELRKIVNEVHAWIVCAAITTPEDMAGNFERIEHITSRREYYKDE